MARDWTAEMNMPADDDPKRWEPGSFGCHEALDRVSMLADVWGDRVVDHPAVQRREDWRNLAHDAQEAMMVLYRAIGIAHFHEGED